MEAAAALAVPDSSPATSPPCLSADGRDAPPVLSPDSIILWGTRPAARIGPGQTRRFFPNMAAFANITRPKIFLPGF